jgi:hypothetical protein
LTCTLEGFAEPPSISLHPGRPAVPCAFTNISDGCVTPLFGANCTATGGSAVMGEGGPEESDVLSSISSTAHRDQLPDVLEISI